MLAIRIRRAMYAVPDRIVLKYTLDYVYEELELLSPPEFRGAVS